MGNVYFSTKQVTLGTKSCSKIAIDFSGTAPCAVGIQRSAIGEQVAEGHLAKGALGTFESAVMGIAGTAPAFSVAVTTAAIVASVGVLSVGSILYCGLIMFGIMLAFIHLSKLAPHAGASYAWVGHVFGKTWGFLPDGDYSSPRSFHGLSHYSGRYIDTGVVGSGQGREH